MPLAQATAPRSPKPRRPWLLAAAAAPALVLAAWLRAGELTRHGLWLDELFTARVVSHDTWLGLWADVARDVHPPLYFGALRLLSSATGGSDMALRLPSVFAGLCAVLAMVALALRLAGPRVAVWSGLLLATSPLAVQLDREARGNSWLGALALASTAALAGVRDGSRNRHVTAYVLAAALMVNTHVFGYFVLLAHAAWLALEWPVLPSQDRRRWALAVGAGGAAGLPWSVVLLDQARTFASDPWYTAPAGDSIGWLWGALSLDNPGIAGLLAIGCVLALLRVPGQPPRPGATGRTTGVVGLLAAGIIGLVIVPQVISYAVAPVLRVRNAFPLVPLIGVAAATGLCAVRPRRLGSVLLALLVVTQLLTSWTVTRRGDAREQWRENRAGPRRALGRG